MSLLMKALEKAAKDRGEVRKEPAVAGTAAPAPARPELSLEPIAPAAPVRAQPESRLPPVTPPPRAAAPAPSPTPPPAGPAARPAPPAAAPARDEAQAQASTVLQAQAAPRRSSGGAITYVRAHPILIFGSLAALAGVAFGIYVYLQIFHPGLLAGRPPLAPAGTLPPLTQAPVATPPAEPLSTADLLRESAVEGAPVAGAPPVAARFEPQPAPVAAAPQEAQRNTIVVSKGSAQPAMNPQLGQAYAALQSGNADEARRLYDALSSADPNNVDAHLGLAALAVERGDADAATRHYLRILELNPRHPLAQSGLIALLGRADPLAAETRLKQLIARAPSAHLYFTLGNLYADQSQWAAAQHAYFQAHHLEPANPDYAFNLAVGLDHVSQPRLALSFYRQAVQLASARGRAHFDLRQAQARIGTLAAQVE